MTAALYFIAFSIWVGIMDDKNGASCLLAITLLILAIYHLF